MFVRPEVGHKQDTQQDNTKTLVGHNQGTQDIDIHKRQKIQSGRLDRVSLLDTFLKKNLDATL